MRAKHVLAFLAMAVAASSQALAQQSLPNTPFMREVIAAANACDAVNLKTSPDAGRKACSESVGQMDRAYRAYPSTPTEVNIYHILRARALESLAAAAMSDDHTYTAESCRLGEEAWAERSQIFFLELPFSFTDDWQTAKDIYKRMLPLCRSGFGTPKNARPAPVD